MGKWDWISKDANIVISLSGSWDVIGPQLLELSIITIDEINCRSYILETSIIYHSDTIYVG